MMPPPGYRFYPKQKKTKENNHFKWLVIVYLNTLLIPFFKSLKINYMYIVLVVDSKTV